MIIAETKLTEMPTNCTDCSHSYFLHSFCGITENQIHDKTTKLSNCPLKEVGTCETCFHSTIDDDGDEVYCEKYCFVADSCNFHCIGWRAK